MNIIDYVTAGGKNLIVKYLDSLSKNEQLRAYQIRQKIFDDGLAALEFLDTRQLQGKLWEIKFFANRIMYIVKDGDNIYFLHACRKQKGKAEKNELETAIRRAKEFELKIN